MEAFFEALRHLLDPKADDLSDRQLAELGLTRADFRLLQSGHPNTRARLEAMAARFGLTPRELDAYRSVAIDLAKTCGHCSEARTCEKALDGKAEWPVDRCPNAHIYAALAAET